jgi:hypothetical protein
VRIGTPTVKGPTLSRQRHDGPGSARCVAEPAPLARCYLISAWSLSSPGIVAGSRRPKPHSVPMPNAGTTLEAAAMRRRAPSAPSVKCTRAELAVTTTRSRSRSGEQVALPLEGGLRRRVEQTLQLLDERRALDHDAVEPWGPPAVASEHLREQFVGDVEDVEEALPAIEVRATIRLSWWHHTQLPDRGDEESAQRAASWKSQSRNATSLGRPPHSGR